MKIFLIAQLPLVLCFIFCGCDNRIKELETYYEISVNKKDYEDIRDAASRLEDIYYKKYKEGIEAKINYYKWKKIAEDAEAAKKIALDKELYVKYVTKGDKGKAETVAKSIAGEYKKIKDYDNYIIWMERTDDRYWNKKGKWR